MVVEETIARNTKREWRISTLGELSYRITKGTTPTTLGGRFTDSGIAFIKVESLTNEGSIDAAKVSYIDDNTNNLLARSKLEKGDVLFTIAGTIGRTALVKEDILPANTNQAVAIVRPNLDRVDPRYIYYALRDETRVERAHSRVVQSVQANFSLTELSAVEIPLPPLSEQRAIAHILGTLDDKIELNRRMNQTLQDMARALFKSWFVDFDPVRAKAVLKQYALGRHATPESEPSDNGATLSDDWTVERARAYLVATDPQIVDLFPDRLVPSELGEIPEGWEVRGLDDIADFTNGLALQRYPAEGDAWLPVIKIAEMRRGYSNRTGKASAKLDPRYIVEDGDLLFSWSGSLELIFWTHGRGALNQHLFKVTSDEFPPWFYWAWIREHLADFRAIAAGKATTMGHIQRHHLADAKVSVPPPHVIAMGDTLIGALVNQRVGQAIQSRALAAQRHALLPRLLSRAIRLEVNAKSGSTSA